MFTMEKVIRFETSFYKHSFQGCLLPENIRKMAFVEIKAPSDIDELEKDGYALTKYIEQTTGMFCYSQIVIDKSFNLTK